MGEDFERIRQSRRRWRGDTHQNPSPPHRPQQRQQRQWLLPLRIRPAVTLPHSILLFPRPEHHRRSELESGCCQFQYPSSFGAQPFVRRPALPILCSPTPVHLLAHSRLDSAVSDRHCPFVRRARRHLFLVFLSDPHRRPNNWPRPLQTRPLSDGGEIDRRKEADSTLDMPEGILALGRAQGRILHLARPVPTRTTIGHHTAVAKVLHDDPTAPVRSFARKMTRRPRRLWSRMDARHSLSHPLSWP